ncbi:site-2 protease family protein [Clostridium neuense]|uniref:Site-2 protease family protein n=1 Tax=Clostridium neuense TaxID=1728934 RepID=A0ABW8TKK2_9CLOT
MLIINFILTSILCYFISGIVHELGHIIVGLINGWKFYLLIVGPLGITRNEHNSIKFYFEKHAAMWGGVSCTLPKEANENNIKIWSKVLLGGPLASIIMGIIFLPLSIITKNIVFLLLGAMPLGMGIICILPLPLKTGILYTDGGRWSRLHKGGQEAAEEIALFKLTENQIICRDFSKIDLNSIESLLKSNDIVINYYGYYYKFQYYKATSNKEKMELVIAKMENIKDKVPALIVKDCNIDKT